MRRAKVKSREAEGREPGLSDPDPGVQMTRDSRLICRKVIGIMGYDKTIELEMIADFDGKLGRDGPATSIVIALGENHADEVAFEPNPKAGDQRLGESVPRVNQIAGHHQSLGSSLAEQSRESGEIVARRALGHRETSSAEGGGFTEVEVRNDQRAGLGQKNGPVGQKNDLGRAEWQPHDPAWLASSAPFFIWAAMSVRALARVGARCSLRPV